MALVVPPPRHAVGFSIAPDPATVFELTALPHLGDVTRFARWLAHDDATADDLVQDTFLRALKSWHTFQEGSDCLAWLITICRNTHFTSYRRTQWFESVATPVLETLAAVDVMERARDAGYAPKPYASAECFGVEEFQRSFRRAVSSARTRRRMMPSSPS